MLTAIDFNFIVQILLNLMIVFFAIKTPDFRSIKQIPVENLKTAEFKYHVVVFALLAVAMDKLLELISDTVPILIVIISVAISFIAVRGVTEEFTALFFLLLPCGPKAMSEKSTLRIRIFSYLVGLVICIVWVILRHWIVHNLIAISICIYLIKTIRVNRGIIGIALLSFLLIQSIIWEVLRFVRSVSYEYFYVNLVKIGLQVQAPASLLIPMFSGRYPSATCATVSLDSLIFPGIFINYLFRYSKIKQYKVSYFKQMMFCYTNSMLMHSLISPQSPAILTIAPALIFIALFFAYRQKDMHGMVNGFEVEDEFKHSSIELG